MTHTRSATNTKRSAHFSKCKRYRYQLERSWVARPSRKTTAVFIGLNPSTADATADDPTIRKCMVFARIWGYNRLVMVNLFAWRATDPVELRHTANPVGSQNDTYLDKAVSKGSLIVACWGENGSLLNRADDLRRRYPRRLHCLQINRSGEPTHPLYLPATLKPIKLTKARRLLK